MTRIFASLGVALIIIWLPGCGGSQMVILEEIRASLSARGCLDAEVTLEDGEVEAEVEVTLEMCAEADVADLPLPELCAELGYDASTDDE